jgi:hypothetical protein
MNDMPIAVISGASLRRVAQRPVGDALDRRVDRAQETIATSRRHEDSDDGDPRRRMGTEMERRDDHRPGDEPTEHEDVAVREVDQLEDAVDERVAQRDERVDGAVREPDERDREEVRRALDEVHPEPQDEQPDEERREERHHVGAGGAAWASAGSV